jgi:hypothetical protein
MRRAHNRGATGAEREDAGGQHIVATEVLHSLLAMSLIAFKGWRDEVFDKFRALPSVATGLALWISQNAAETSRHRAEDWS